MNKLQLIEQVRRAHDAWEAAVNRLDEAQILASGTAGGWSVKDIIAHLAWHEVEMVGLLQSHTLAGSEMWGWPLDERNHAIYLANRDRPLAELLWEERQVYADLLACLEALDEADLHDASRFAGMPDDWQPWELIAENTCEHFRDHLPEVADLSKG
jgi:hypothetical protein